MGGWKEKAGGSRPVSLLLPLIWNSPLWRKKLSVEQRNANINLTHQRRLFEGGEGEATPRWDSHPPMWTGKTKEERRKKTSWIERASVRLSLTARWVEFAKNCSLSPPYLSCLSAARGLVRSWHTGLWTLWTANHLRTALLKHYFSSQPSQYITFRLKKKIRSCSSSPRQWGE